jgi:hypothetical protein
MQLKVWVSLRLYRQSPLQAIELLLLIKIRLHFFLSFHLCVASLGVMSQF